MVSVMRASYPIRAASGSIGESGSRGLVAGGLHRPTHLDAASDSLHESKPIMNRLMFHKEPRSRVQVGPRLYSCDIGVCNRDLNFRSLNAVTPSAYCTVSGLPIVCLGII